MATSSTTGIAVTSNIFLSFLMSLWKPVIEIDGQVHAGRWGRVVLPASTGRHEVKCHWKYYWFLPANPAQVTVAVFEGSATEVTYDAGWLWFRPGKMTVTESTTVAA